jgi:hypothetical protein
MQQNPLAGIRFDQTTGVICENCKNNSFQEVYLLRKVSKFLVAANTDKDQLIPIPAFSCSKCHHINKEFLPEGIKNESNSDASSSDNG